MSAILENWAVATGWEKVSFLSNPSEGQSQRMFKLPHNCNAGDLGSIPGLGRSSGKGKGYLLQHSGLEISMDCIVHGVTKSWTWLNDFHSPTHSLTHSHASKVMLKNLQARLQQYMNWEAADVQPGFRQCRGARDQIANICWIIEKRKNSRKVYFCFIDYAKAFDCVDHNKLENSETDGEGQGSLVCCSPWGHKESDMMEWLKNQKAISQFLLFRIHKNEIKGQKILIFPFW